MATTYKSIKVDGYTITFKMEHGRVCARIPKITSQIMGIGKTKAEAAAVAKKWLKKQKKL